MCTQCLIRNILIIPFLCLLLFFFDHCYCHCCCWCLVKSTSCYPSWPSSSSARIDCLRHVSYVLLPCDYILLPCKCTHLLTILTLTLIDRVFVAFGTSYPSSLFPTCHPYQTHFVKYPVFVSCGLLHGEFQFGEHVGLPVIIVLLQ